jgi:hypothetical protein
MHFGRPMVIICAPPNVAHREGQVFFGGYFAKTAPNETPLSLPP